MQSALGGWFPCVFADHSPVGGEQNKLLLAQATYVDRTLGNGDSQRIPFDDGTEIAARAQHLAPRVEAPAYFRPFPGKVDKTIRHRSTPCARE